MEKQNNQAAAVLQTIGLVVIIVVFAPVVINGILAIGAGIISKFQPKQYDLTVTYEDGTTAVRRGTKKELEKWLEEQKGKEAS